MTSVILVAGGVGTRMGAPTPKQFLPLRGKMVASYSLDLFRFMPEVVELVVVCAPEYRHQFPSGVLFADPGPRRQDSVYNGLQKTSQPCVLIHDAARPLIDAALVRAVLNAVHTYGAATAATLVPFTVKEGTVDGMVVKTLDRSRLWDIQTPQGARRDLLIQGFEKANQQGLTLTDDVSLIELRGLPVKLVQGPSHNLKLTLPRDFAVAEQLLCTLQN